MTSLTDLNEEFTWATNRARACGGLGFGAAVLRNILVSPPPNVGRSSGARVSGSEVSDGAFFSAGSSSGSGTRTTPSYTLNTLMGTRAATGPLMGETMTGFGSGNSSSTNVTPSTATSYRRAGLTSYLGDTQGSYTYTGTSPSRSVLSGEGR